MNESMAFSFLSTTQDLVDAYRLQADREGGVRAGLRWFLVLLGSMWVVGGGMAVVLGPERLKGLIFLIPGAAIVWNFFIGRIIAIRRIRASGGPDQQTTVRFSEVGIDLDVAGLGALHADWSSLVGYHRTGRGILFHFSNGNGHWLPRRAFADARQMDALVKLLERFTRPK